VLSTDQKGAIAETAIAHAAIKLGIGVYKPLSDGGRYDLIFDVGRRLVRVQCKWAACHGDVLVIRCCTWRRGREGMIRRPYLPGEIDAIAAYSLDLDRCFFIPFDRFTRRAAIQLRLTATRNNQKLGINWAEDFEFEATLRELVGP
jgi:hypothetical protein